MKYRKIPLELEAVQYNGINVQEIENFVGKKLQVELETDAAYQVGKAAPVYSIIIPTLEGDMKAMPFDYIIKGVKGEFYPCKPDVFEQIYEKVLPEDIDEECLELCEELNKLDGVETNESCCGHLKSPYNIFLCCKSFTSIAIIARAIDKRYCGTNYVWKLIAETSDVNPCFNFMLTSEIAYNTAEEMKQDVSKICENINYWKTNFYEYFNTNNK